MPEVAWVILTPAEWVEEQEGAWKGSRTGNEVVLLTIATSTTDQEYRGVELPLGYQTVREGNWGGWLS